MNCPTCPAERLVMTERSGIEIDYCPNCRGVWLDRGELDKIIERSLASSPAVATPPPASAAPEQIREHPDLVKQHDGERFDGDRYGTNRSSDRRDDRYDDRDRDRYDDRSKYNDADRRPKKRRESLLSELFDF